MEIGENINDESLGINHMEMEADAVIMGGSRFLCDSLEQLKIQRVAEAKLRWQKSITDSTAVAGTNSFTVDI